MDLLFSGALFLACAVVHTFRGKLHKAFRVLFFLASEHSWVAMGSTI